VAFDVAHTGQSLTAERLTFAEIPDAWIDVRIDRLADGSLAATFTDVTRHVVAEERLRHRASHDPLTGLPNRTLLEERLGVLTSELVADQHVALVLVDVDGLSELNRDLGHQHGDRFVVEVANRLVRNVVGAELVARVGSSDFAVITRPAATQAETMERARWTSTAT
jgi:GGDEF domain-containing protein